MQEDTADYTNHNKQNDRCFARLPHLLQTLEKDFRYHKTADGNIREIHYAG